MKNIQKLISSALVLCLLLGLMVPVFASAADEDTPAQPEMTNKGMAVKKEAYLADDGTYTINLEAFAVGETTTTTVTRGVPLDIVLVLDQSGSMEDTIPSTTTTYTARPSTAYSQNVFSAIDEDLYYKASDGGYYKVETRSGTLNSTGEMVWAMCYTDSDGRAWAFGTPIPYNSGSYDRDATLYTGVLYTVEVNSQNKLELLKKSATSFINDIYENGEKFNVDHRVSIVGFACDAKQYGSTASFTNTGLFVDGTLNQYGDDEPQVSVEYADLDKKNDYYVYLDPDEGSYYYPGYWILTPISRNDNSTGNVLVPAGFYNCAWIDGKWQFTYVKTGDEYTYYFEATSSNRFYEAETILTSTDYKNSLVSVDDGAGITDSITTSIDNLQASGATFIRYGIEMANNVFINNPLTEADQAAGRQRVVVVLTDGEPGQFGYNKIEAYLALNRGYEVKQDSGAIVYTLGLFSEDPDNQTHDFLKFLSSNYPNATGMTASGDKISDKYHFNASDADNLNDMFSSITSDIISPSTTVTLDATAVMKDFITQEFKLPAGFNAESNVEIQVWDGTVDADENYTWTNCQKNPEGITASVDTEKQVVNITGFDYSAHYITQAHQGQKLVVVITGLEATDAAITGSGVYTNTSDSGIYVNASATEAFVKFVNPTVTLTEKSYVVDYAKPFIVNPNDWNASSVLHLSDHATGMAKFASPLLALTMKYGQAEVLTAAELKYTPKTTCWDGYDVFYAFGRDMEDRLNQWSKINVIPASSVYYEDTFVTNEATGTIGIEYSGSWTEDGTSSGNSEDADGPVHGWIDDLADDSGYSDGSAHVSTAGGAKATFNFTGTGVDIYSRTNSETGVVRVLLYKNADSDKPVLSKYYIMDNESVSGDYYQIPTVFFSGLEHGTYKVQIEVVTNDQEQSVTYYLDGIRVYNPMAPSTEDETVKDAYGTGFSPDALFTTIRSTLLDSSSSGEAFNDGGAVFIDKNASNEEGKPTYDIAVYTDYGPKNEVYLAPGQAVTFKLEAAPQYLYVGMKTPVAGSSVTAQFSGENIQGTAQSQALINHTTDLYYRVIPTAVSDGEGGISHYTVTITNASTNDALLSITKMVTPGSASDAATMMAISPDEAVAAFCAFEALPIAEYDAEPVPQEPETPVEPEQPAPGGDVVIDNTLLVGPVFDENWLNQLFKMIFMIFGN